MGGLPLCSYISISKKLPMIMVRDTAKHYGTSKQIEGKYNTKNKCIIIEDVITKGKSSLECFKLIKKKKAKVVGYACLINRSNKKTLKIKKGKIISQIKLDVPTYSKKNLPNFLKKIPITKPGSRFLR